MKSPPRRVGPGPSPGGRPPGSPRKRCFGVTAGRPPAKDDPPRSVDLEGTEPGRSRLEQVLPRWGIKQTSRNLTGRVPSPEAGDGPIMVSEVRPPRGDQGLDLGPEGVPVGPLGPGESGQCVGVADAGEVGVLLPVGQTHDDGGPGLRWARGEEIGTDALLDAEPVEGLSPEGDPGGVVGRGIVLPPADAGQHGDAGGIISVLGPAVGGEVGLGGQGDREEAGGGRGEVPAIGRIGEGQDLVVVPGLDRSPGSPRPAPPHRELIFRLANRGRHLPGHVRARPGQFEGPAELGERLLRPPQAVEQPEAEIGVGQFGIGPEPDRLAVLGDGVVDAPLGPEEGSRDCYGPRRRRA